MYSVSLIYSRRSAMAHTNDYSLVPGDNPHIGSTHFERWLSHFKRDGSAQLFVRSTSGSGCAGSKTEKNKVQWGSNNHQHSHIEESLHALHYDWQRDFRRH